MKDYKEWKEEQLQEDEISMRGPMGAQQLEARVKELERRVGVLANELGHLYDRVAPDHWQVRQAG